MSRKLTRSRDHCVIGGVCGGLGEYFRMDAVIFRFAFAALLLAGGSSILIYILLWLVIPKELPVSNHAAAQPSGLTKENEPGEKSVNHVMGLLLIAVGVFFLLNNIVPYFRLEKLWPAILVIIGLGLLFQRGRKDGNDQKN